MIQWEFPPFLLLPRFQTRRAHPVNDQFRGHEFVTKHSTNDLGTQAICHIVRQMISSSRRILTLAAISAIVSAPVSQAAVSQNFSPKERAMAGLLLFLMMENGYQPSYGFSQSPQNDRVSVLLSIVGGHLSAPNPPQTSEVTVSGSGTLTLTGNHGYSETLGVLTGSGSIGHGATTGSTISLGFSNTTATTWNSSTLTVSPWTQSFSSPGTGLASDQLFNLDIPSFSNPWNGAVYSIDYSSSWTNGTEIAIIPEPSALLLGGIGSLALLRRRRTA